MPKWKPDKKCRKCRQNKPKEQFAICDGRAFSGKRSGTCDDCRERSNGPYECAKCKKVLPIESFGRRLNGDRNIRCIDCVDIIALKLKRCVRCGEDKPRKLFVRIGQADYARYCISCHEGMGNKRRSDMLPQKCAQCDGPIFSGIGESRKRATERKYCGMRCTAAAARFVSATCRQCEQVLPRKAFPVSIKAGARAVRCIECLKALHAGRVTQHAGYHAFSNISRLSHQMAKRSSRNKPLSRSAVQKLVDSPCWYCGDVTQTAVVKNTHAPCGEGNMLPVCMTCKNIQGKRTVKQHIEWVLRVAQRHTPATSPAPEAPKKKLTGPTSYGRQLQREFAGKRRDGSVIKRQLLLPPHVQETQHLGETFEQKLARHARARAEMAEAGKRAKPEDDAHAV